MGIQVCKFNVKIGCEDEFFRMNENEWPEFLRMSPEYRGTEIMRNTNEPGVYLTMDRWTSQGAFRIYVNENKQVWDAISARHLGLCTSFEDLGFYEIGSR